METLKLKRFAQYARRSLLGGTLGTRNFRDVYDFMRLESCIA